MTFVDWCFFLSCMIFVLTNEIIWKGSNIAIAFLWFSRSWWWYYLKTTAQKIEDCILFYLLYYHVICVILTMWFVGSPNPTKICFMYERQVNLFKEFIFFTIWINLLLVLRDLFFLFLSNNLVVKSRIF
jgi:hypothetical protein